MGVWSREVRRKNRVDEWPEKRIEAFISRS
jgi:hypothetical protein